MERIKLTKSPTNPTSAADRSAARLALFGPPPLIEGEDAAAYDELLVRISADVKPADILEDIWVRDVVDFTWEIFALRRLKVNLMTATSHKGVRAILQPIIGYSKADTLPAIGPSANRMPSSGLTPFSTRPA